jgi:O-acetyl-ADP-ribose deacetylase (regulator of RNase III)
VARPAPGRLGTGRGHNGAVAPRLQAVLGDITVEQVDAVVNAANSRLAGGGGVDGAIHRAAGAAELRAACAALGGCPPGQAKATPGFRLPARWIIHTVGPVWSGGHKGEAETLASCYRSSLAVADELGARSVAFPAISTGVYGYPPELAAAVAVDTLTSAETAVDLVRLVAFDPTTYELYLRLGVGAG